MFMDRIGSRRSMNKSWYSDMNDYAMLDPIIPDLVFIPKLGWIIPCGYSYLEVDILEGMDRIDPY
jgi:hypothetical protein